MPFNRTKKFPYNNVIFVLSGFCSLCRVPLATAKRKFEKHYFGAIALTQELKKYQ